jgi:CHAT domain-containing protein
MSKEPGIADLIRSEQDTRWQLSALMGNLSKLVSRPQAEQDASILDGLRQTISQLQAAQKAIAQEISQKFPEYADLINPKPMTIEQARKTLRPGEALIATYVGDTRTYVWAIPQSGAIAVTAVDLGREDLSDEVAFLRGALDPGAATLGDIPEFDVASAYGLYDRLLAPVSAGWKDAKSLLVVAHGPLGYLPMSLLPTKPVDLGPEQTPLFSRYKDVPWLARSHAVTMLPSVGSLKTLRSLPPGNATRKAFAGFGDPWFNQAQATEAQQPKQVAALSSRGLKVRGLPVNLRAAPKTQNVDSAELALLPRLPETADEVLSIALAMNADVTQSVFTGQAASEGHIKSMDLSGFKVLAFATHGLVPGDLNGLLQPALALSSPKVTGGTDDGLLTMSEILALKLDADWVVLSACNTGSGEGAGAEAVSGLGRAFFYAGTRALLVSNWPVETSSAKILTTDLFRRQAEDPNLDRAEALRRAMTGLIDSDGSIDPETGKTVFSYAHPLFWAPFTLIGDGGGGRPAS